MTIWVDFTNWKGRRAWREIKPQSVSFAWMHYPEGSGKDSERTWLLHVDMIDKDGARRSLRMLDIHAFAEEPSCAIALAEKSDV